MAGFEDFAPLPGGPLPARRDAGESFRSDSLVQNFAADYQNRERDMTRLQTLERETGMEGGGRIPTSAVVEGSRAGPPPAPGRTGHAAFDAFLDPAGPTAEVAAVKGWLPKPSVDGFKTAVGNVAALADMVFSLPGQLVGVGADIGARAYGFGKGVTRREAAQAGEEGRHMAEPIMNPLQKLMKATGHGEAYDASQVASALQTLGTWIDKGGEWIEEKTKGGLLKEDVTALVNAAMAGGGVSGLSSAGRWAQRKPWENRPYRGPGYEAEQPLEGQWMPPEAPRRVAPPPRPVERDITPQPEARPPAGQLQLPEWATALGVGAAAYTGAMATGQDGLDALALGAAALAVKQKGGMWHPKAADVLAGPLTNLERLRIAQLPATADHTAVQAAFKDKNSWATRASQTYLNRHMGTETDPLKDIEIPFGEGMKKWGEVTDALVTSKPAGFFKHQALGPSARSELSPAYEPLMRAPPDEPVWSLDTASQPDTVYSPLKAANALKSYLSHVGDYLRENVLPQDSLHTWYNKQPAKYQRAHPWPEGFGQEANAADLTTEQAVGYRDWKAGVQPDYAAYKAINPLAQYDLVRAVKETAKRDAEMAKAMEREAAESSKDLPVYKDYGDGYKWVELKLPEKLTEGQAKAVQRRRAATDTAGLANNEYDLWDALGADGKPIRNNYTADLASGKSPEEAFLAGQLAREGNQLGHCVGGYCDSVSSGESKIYSLRDAKGKSHVTIETSNEEAISNPEFIAAMKSKYGGEFPTNIEQIKGKQNRAPAEAYRKYVQDFVKSGKWGEVGDLEGTGLIKHPKTAEFLTAEEGKARALAVIEKNWPDGKMYQDPRSPNVKALLEGQHEGIEGVAHAQLQAIKDVLGFETVPPKGHEAGSIDPALLKTLATGTFGALIGAYLTEKEPLIGAAVGAAAGIFGAKLVKHGAIKTAEETLGLVSTRLRHASEPLRLRAVASELAMMKRPYDYFQQTKPFFTRIEELKGEARLAAERDIFNLGPQGFDGPGAAEVFRTLAGLGLDMVALGRLKDLRENYFPRSVKDLEGLKNHYGEEVKTHLEDRLATAEEKSLRLRGRGLTESEQAEVVDSYLGSRQLVGGLPGYAKERTVHKITPEIQGFYHTPAESFHQYVRDAVEDLETAKLFGRHIVTKKSNGQNYTDVASSAGQLVAAEVRAGKMTKEQATEVRELLQARYEGREAMKGWLQDVKNVTYMGLLGNFASGATQMGDSVMVAFAHGMRPMVEAMMRKATGQEYLTAKDVGLLNHIAEEFSSTRPSARYLRNLLKAAWGPIDRVGKDLNLNAAIVVRKNQLHTASGRKALQEELEPIWGEQLPDLIEDIKAARPNQPQTPRVELMAFSDLSDAQPITRLEMTQAGLENPNARFLYTLHTWQLKQIDIARRKVYDEFKAGHKVKGMRNAVRLGMALAAAGIPGLVVRDLLFGRDVDLTANDLLFNALKTYGWSEWAVDRAGKKPLQQTLENLGWTTMPIVMMADRIWDQDPRAFSYFPLGGNIFYNRFAGGNEKAEKAQDQREMTRLKKSTPPEDWKEVQRERKRERLINKLEGR